ncbi:MAG: type II toxin-antitoxin system Phd/YefM family antitoxin [Caulobacteraceae bacterium]
MPRSRNIRTVNIHEAKTHLSRLLDQAVNGESFIIAKAGKPLVTVTGDTSPGGKATSALRVSGGSNPNPRQLRHHGRRRDRGDVPRRVVRLLIETRRRWPRR